MNHTTTTTTSQFQGEDGKTRLRAARGTAASYLPVQKGTGMSHGGATVSLPAGVFGKKKNWADQLADEEALQAQGKQAGPASSSSHMVPMAMRPGAQMGRQAAVPYVMQGKPPSPVDATVKFVNSTVENLQSQIKKEEAPKKKRTRTSPEQLRILQKAFATDPMPSSQARLALSKKLGMNPRAVQVWFQNRRAKAKRAEQMGLTGQEDDFPSSGASEDDDLPAELTGQYRAARMLHHQHDPMGLRKGGAGGAMSSRAASMSSVHPYMQPGDLSSYYNAGLQHGGPGAAFFDPSSFMEPVEHTPFDAGEMVLPGLDFYNGAGAGNAINGGGPGGYPQYSMPMQGMFSFPPGPYDPQGSAMTAGLCYGYPPGTGMYGEDPTGSHLAEDVLGRFAVEDHGLGPINPLSALLDLPTERPFHPNREEMAQAQAAALQQQQMMRRSYSLNDIHAQLTTQQIQTLESVGLPSIAAQGNQQSIGSAASSLSCIREEEDSPTATRSASPPGSVMGASGHVVVDQDQLLSTIDDLRMGAFWDTSAPGS